MHVLIFNFEYPPLGGGGGVATAQFAQELARRHPVTVITTRFRTLPTDEQQGQLRIIRVPVLGRRKFATASFISLVTFVPSALWYGWRFCRHHRPDVINAQFVIPSGIPATLLARWFNIPLVISFIGGDIYDPTKDVSPHRHPLFRFLVRWLARQARVCTAISNDTKLRAEQLHGVQSRIVVTPLGVDTQAVLPATRPDLGLPNEGPLIVSIGRLIPRKCFGTLIALWATIPTAQLVIIGSGPLRAQLQAQAVQQGVSERVHLLGYISELQKRQVLAAADVYVSAAEHEGFGIVFLEAMAAGLPIVATDNGGQTDFLRPEHNALLVRPHDPIALTAALTRILGDEPLRQSMHQNNLHDVQRYDVAVVTQEFETVLREAAGV